MKKTLGQVERSRWIRPQLWQFLIEVVNSAVQTQELRDALGDAVFVFVQQ